MPDKKVILIVDDDADVRKFVIRFLTMRGFDIVQASSGDEALRVLQKITPDLVISDVRMPGVSGAGFIAKIMNPDGSLKYPVLVVTAYSAMSELFKDVPINGFLRKPFDATALLKEVDRILASGGKTSRQKRVLIVDDDEKQREILVRKFGDAGYLADSAADGSEAIAKAIQISPDVVVAKEVMPLMNAHAMVSVLQSIPKTGKMPTVIYSAKTLTLSANSDILENRSRHPVLPSDRPDDILNAVRNLSLG